MITFWFFIFILAFTAADDQDIVACPDTCKCDITGDVLTIQCANRGLDKLITSWPAQKNTIVVYWAGNRIKTLEPLPKTDAALKIVLSHCEIENLQPKLFVETRNIKLLDLSYNALTGEQMTSDKFIGPYSETAYEPLALEHLNLSYNKIHSLNKNVFEHMPNLKRLDLEGNNFYVFDDHTQLALSSIRTLQYLNLANNKMTEIVKEVLEGHDNLSEINLSNNELDFVPSSLTHIGKSLEILILDGNPIIELTDESFLGLGNITDLSINNVLKLKYITANTFVPMYKLKKLSLCNNLALKDIDREAFGQNQNLEEFYLNNNELYRLDAKLLPWSKLRVFEFHNNPLDCSCDLYNITMSLSSDIRRDENGPYCRDSTNTESQKVADLTEDICLRKSAFKIQKEYIEYHFSIMRMVLIILSVVLTMTAFLAAVIGYLRYRKYYRNRNYPFTSQVLYNPLSDNPSKF